MEPDQRTLLLSVGERSLSHWRCWYFIAPSMMLLLFGFWGFFFFEDHSLLTGLLGVALFVIPAAGFILLNGYRSVIAVRLYEEGIDLVTPLSVRSFAWEEVDVVTRLLSFYIFAPRAIWPYHFASLGKDGSRAIAMIRQRARRRRSWFWQ